MLTLKQAKRLIIASIGGTLLFLGALFLFLPGSGMILILLGLAVLATEFVWAKQLLERVRGKHSEQK